MLRRSTPDNNDSNKPRTSKCFRVNLAVAEIAFLAVAAVSECSKCQARRDSICSYTVFHNSPRTYVFLAFLGHARGLGCVEFLKRTPPNQVLGRFVEFHLLPYGYNARTYGPIEYRKPSPRSFWSSRNFGMEWPLGYYLNYSTT